MSNATTAPAFYTLSLHDALPISALGIRYRPILNLHHPAIRKLLRLWLPLFLYLAVANVSLLVEDRKSTRLNSSHTVISYAVFCLKKKIVMTADDLVMAYMKNYII